MIELLKELGIPPDLDYGEILDRLKDANTEYLERIENCNDQARLAELKDTQKKIESAIGDMSANITRSGKSAKTVQSTPVKTQKKVQAAAPSKTQLSQPPEKTPDEPESPDSNKAYFQEGFALYKKGDYKNAAMRLWAFAIVWDMSALLICGDCYEKLNDLSKAKEVYFYAAKEGDKVAALKLAKLYYDERDYNTVYEWAKKAYDPSDEKIITALADLYVNLNNYLEAYRCIRDYMYTLQGFERYKARESMHLYLDKLMSSGLTGTWRKSRCLSRLINESKDKEEKNFSKSRGKT